jgi:GR25 family glycosyltransferase involved in LPS biosynthesis
MNIFFNKLPIYYINLDDRKDRRIYIESHFEKHGIKDFTRISAVDGSLNNYLSDILDNPNFGCTASHIKAIETFYNSGNEYGFVCEDDIDISNVKKINFNFLDTIKLFNPEIYCLQTTVQYREDLEINFNLHKRTFWDFATTSYILNRSYAKKIIDYYKKDNLICLDNFRSRKIIDYRGGVINTSPVADELVYSLCETYTLPIFSFIESESSINNNTELINQIKRSILKFNEYWSKYYSIDIYEVFGIIDKLEEKK